MKKRIIYLFIIIILIIITVSSMHLKNEFFDKKDLNSTSSEITYNLFKEVNRTNKNVNFIFSPLSIEYALSILRDGAKGNTYKEISNALQGYNITKDLNIKNRISIANALFINEFYKNYVSQNYITDMNKKYNADIIFDRLENGYAINKWIKEKTYNLIPNFFEENFEAFVLAIINAVAIDVSWTDKFNCNFTVAEKFTKADKKTIDVAMMKQRSSSEEISYIENENAKGVIKPYLKYNKSGKSTIFNSDTVQLEFIGILPNNDINEYLNSFSNKELDSLINSAKQSNSEININLSLPRFSYDFKMDLKEILNKLGIYDIFSIDKADLSKMTSDKNKALFVSKSYHRATINLNEMGTKAAAATYVSVDFAGPELDEPEIIDIKFNKPFIYIIKEKNNSDILFLGIVHEPELWKSDSEKCSD